MPHTITRICERRNTTSMKFLNKTISVFLTLAVMLSMCITPIKAEGEAVTKTLAQTGKAAERVNALGIISDNDMALDANGEVTRAGFASWLIKAMNMTNMKASVSHYGDIPSDYWAYDAVNVACDFGYVSEADTFEPTRAVNYNEALKMLVVAAGYGDVAEREGGYPNGYYTAAQMADLTSGVPAAPNGVVTNAVAAALLDNFLDAEVMELVNGKYQKSEKTVLKKYHNITIYDATVVSVDLKRKNITIDVDGTEATYEASSKVALNALVQDKAKVYVQDTDNGEIVVYVYQKGSVMVLNDFICAVDEHGTYDVATAVSAIDEITLKNENEDYKTDKDLEVWLNNEKLDSSDLVALNGTFARVYLFDDKVRKIEAYELSEGGIVQRADEKQINFTRGEQNKLVLQDLEDADDLKLFIDGVESANMLDLSMDMIFDYWCNADKSEFVIVASGRHYYKTLESYSNKYLKFDGKQYAIDGRYGVYAYSPIKDRYVKDGSLDVYKGKNVEIHVDDNMCVRYVKISQDVAELNTFLGVITGWRCDGQPEDDPGKLKVYKISSGVGEKEFTVAKNIKRDSDRKSNDLVSLDYARSVSKNADGKGFFKFTTNTSGEITKIEVPELWGHSFDYGTGNIAKTNNGWLKNLCVKNAVIFAVFDDNGKFTVKVLDWDTNLRQTSGSPLGFKVTSDYDPLYNPLPDYVMLSGGIKDLTNGTPEYVVRAIDELADDQVKITFMNKYGNQVRTFNKSTIDNLGFEIKKNMLIKVKDGYFGEERARIQSISRDWSLPSDQWVVDNATWTPDSNNGFYKVDAVLYADRDVAQFMINGEPTDVIPYNEYVDIYELVNYTEPEFVIKSLGNNPLTYALTGEYNVWVYIYGWGATSDQTKTIGMLIMEKK